MEPSNLNFEPEGRWEQRLRTNDRDGIADDGFTARVLAHLPPPPPRWNAAPSWRWSRTAAIAGGALAGVGGWWSHGGAEVFTWGAAEQIGRALTDPSLGLALAVAGVTLAALYVPALRRLWT